MSICKICEKNGYPGITIAWDNNIKTKEGRYVPLESDKKTPHKHYEPSKPIPEPNDYPNPITAPTKTENAAALKWVRSITDSKPDSLAVVKAIAAALNEYIQIKEAGQ
jgi:hypothetical protein